VEPGSLHAEGFQARIWRKQNELAIRNFVLLQLLFAMGSKTVQMDQTKNSAKTSTVMSYLAPGENARLLEQVKSVILLTKLSFFRKPAVR
jgi:hypothetical protein